MARTGYHHREKGRVVRHAETLETRIKTSKRQAGKGGPAECPGRGTNKKNEVCVVRYAETAETRTKVKKRVVWSTIIRRRRKSCHVLFYKRPTKSCANAIIAMVPSGT